ncbi:MAG: glycosyltransferase family 2 protein [Nanoarchaeota archaeon]|nr:glycosyltransferase family 2 protein [Nanoarchaeota archaeon]
MASKRIVRKANPQKTAVKSPLVSIQVPTYNSERTLKKTLDALKRQNYKNVEIIVIDGYSKDKTVKIAKEEGCRVIMCKGGLLEARIVGARESRGEYVLFIDSDQIIHSETINKAIELMKKYDYLWLYERAINRKEILPSLYDADRRLVQKHLNEGVVLPRFFKKDLLIKAMDNIPKDIYDACSAHEHLLIFHEVRKISNNLGVVGNLKDPAVEHIEPSNLLILFKKQYRWGRTTREFYDKGFYREMIRSKNSFRGFHLDEIGLSVKSFVLRVLRGIPYKLGYHFG